jgi:predicted transcriptional regulator
MSERDGKQGDERCEPHLQDTVRLSAEGVAKVLGDLEARVMRCVWSIEEPASARRVHEAVARDHGVALHTVITVLNKLVKKGLLRRFKQADVYHYEAMLGEREFIGRISRRVVEGILSLAPEAVAASFVDVLADRDPARLDELYDLVRRRMEEREDR